MRILLLGNSGSGKSWHARGLAARHGLAHLDLDAVLWEPGRIALLRPCEEVEGDLDRFVADHGEWVIEGCYEELIARCLPACTELVFMNPGLETCLDNNRRRPWEPRKYDRAEDQERMLPYLLAWVAAYYTRPDAWAYAAHRRVFDGFDGPKREVTSLEVLSPSATTGSAR